MFLLDVAKLPAEGAEDLCGLVRGSVVDNNDLQLVKGLSEHAVDGFGQVTGVVVGGNDDTDPWDHRLITPQRIPPFRNQSASPEDRSNITYNLYSLFPLAG